MSTAMSSSMSLMCGMAIEICDENWQLKSVTKILLFVTFIFVTENGLGLDFRGSGTFYDDFKM